MHNMAKASPKSGKTLGFALGLLGLSLAASTALGQAPAAATVLAVDKTASTITYHMVHKLHKFDAVSKAVEGSAKVLENGQAQVGVRAGVESFDSGNSNRDAHMKETVQAASYPYVSFTASGDASRPVPTGFTAERNFTGELSFHGVKKQVTVPVKLTFQDGGGIQAVAHLTLSLDEFKIERPSLMFVKVDDALNVDVNVTFKPKK